MSTPTDVFYNRLAKSFEHKSFVQLKLGGYRGDTDDLKKVMIKEVMIKKQRKLSFVFRYKTKDITKNYLPEEGWALIQSLITPTDFSYAGLFTIEGDVEFQWSPKKGWKIKEKQARTTELPNGQHDHIKKRKIAAEGQAYLHDLKITDAQGRVRPHGQDKYRQINHYIEILAPLLKDLPQKEELCIVDMGSGKGYLTFALYDYLNHVAGNKSIVTGVEYRQDLVDLCNTLAKKSKFDRLHFTQGSIQDYESEEATDVLIALHACDTATDDAIYKGIQSGAELIVVAPCCHKQIRREMEKAKLQNETHFLTRHGIFMERQAEMVTDGLRALLLELNGYTTRVFEFISTEHTPKNVLIVAQKRKKPFNNQQEIRDKIESSKKFFGIQQHYLESLLSRNES